MAYSLGVTRYYLYGLLFGASMLLQGIALEGLYEGVPMLAAGAIVTIIGAVLLARFLKQYPPLDPGGGLAMATKPSQSPLWLGPTHPRPGPAQYHDPALCGGVGRLYLPEKPYRSHLGKFIRACEQVG